MLKRTLFWANLIMASLGLCLFCTTQQSGQPDMTSLLPSGVELGEWKALYEPEIVEGEDLYLLINGGAEIYHEYGFKRAMTQSYENAGGKSINIEIYEMTGPASAFGVYTFKTGKNGMPSKVGNEGLLEGYYLNFWKGPYVVTLIGFGSDDETLEGLSILGEAVASKIHEGGQAPRLASIFLDDDPAPDDLTYMQGGLALFNRYEFDTDDLFALREGVMAEYDDAQVFVFRYTDDVQCVQQFKLAQDRLSKSERFQTVETAEPSLILTDSENQWLQMESDGPDIVIVRSPDRTRLDPVSRRIKYTLRGEE